MPVLSCTKFFGDLYHSRQKYLNTNKYLGISNYLHHQIQTPSGIARGAAAPGLGGGGRQNPAKEFKKNYIRRIFFNPGRIK